AQDRAVQVDVLAPGEVPVEARAHFDEGGYAAGHPDGAPRRPHDPGEQLQDGALPRAVGADDAEGLRAVHAERDVLQGPEVALVRRRSTLAADEAAGERGHQVPEGMVTLPALESLGHPLYVENAVVGHGGGQTFSAKRGSSR